MTIHAASKNIFKLLIAVSFISVLASCGGGSSGPKKDTTPNAITFAPVTNAAVSTDVTSAPVTISGINQSVSISVSGGTYSIGGGAFTNTTGTVTNGQVVTVKVKSSDKFNTPVSATLTVGGISGTFTVTAPDVIPDAFTFTPVTGAGAKAVTSSNEITVTGIDVAVPVSITNGEYKIGSGDFTNVAGTVNKDQKVIVRATSSDKPSTDVTAALTIGGVTGNFVVTTKTDEAAPAAQILFPPPVSMTEGNTILVRGSASDEFSTIASVKVNGVAATTTDGFKNWQALVPLIDTDAPVTKTTENIIQVATEDSVGNESDDVVNVAIRQASVNTSFPSGDNGFNWPWAVVIDKASGKNQLLVTNDNSNVLSVDLNSGERNIFISVPNCSGAGLAINSESKRLYLSCAAGSVGQIFDFDLLDVSKFQSHLDASYKTISSILSNAMNGSTTIAAINDTDGALITTNDFNGFNVLSDATQLKPSADNPINSSWSMAYDGLNKRYLVSDYTQQSIFSVDAATGIRKVFSSNGVGNGPAFGPVGETYVSGIAVDELRRRALVVEASSGKIFAIDLETGNRVLHSSVTSDNQYNDLNESYQIAILDPNSYAFVTSHSLRAVFAVDMITGHRVIFSK